MIFQSILFDQVGGDFYQEALTPPECFSDLNLDQVVADLTAGRQDYNLKPFFYTPLHDRALIEYRQAVMRDLETPAVLAAIKRFAEAMRKMYRYLGVQDQIEYPQHRQGWFLEAVIVYCAAARGLADDLAPLPLASRGLLAFREYLADYVQAETFTRLEAATTNLKAALASVRYCLLIRGNCIKVRPYESESDYSVEVEDTFAKFKQGAVKDYRNKLVSGGGVSHVDAQILTFVARLYPEIFANLEAYCAQNHAYLAPTIEVFDREIQFYVAYLEHIADLKRAGLHFCYPQVTTDHKKLFTYGGFDMALAGMRVTENAPVVCNDFYLEGPERLFVVSGPNQGGKTTFARMVGQLHYLASLGCPVPGSRAQLFLCDQIFTHFEQEEDIRNLRGKLQDDLVRIHAILAQATSRSLIIMNEIFTSTTLQDAVFLSKKIMESISALDALGVCVTFIDELATLNEKTVSMVSTIVPDNPAMRTYKIMRKPADGLAYAIFIAEKHGLTYERLKERIPA